MARHDGSPSPPAEPASNGSWELSDYAFEALRQDGELVLYRALREGDPSSVLVVAPAREEVSAAGLARLEHEFSLRDQLPGEGVARPLALVRHEGCPLLVREDPGGEPLDRLCGAPWALGDFLRVAVALAAAVGRLHGQSLIHKDLKPANVLIDLTTGKVSLTGFGLASRLPRERAAPAPPEYLTGTLAYLAPEQTGRMNRSIDSRADLYALGVTFYQLLTGALPFQAADPMEWVHCHIARPPVPPAERVAGLPEPVLALVLKLLAKTPEERYQTAAGLEHDLRRCLAAWESRGPIDHFPLGEHDTPDRLLIPEKLYGREAERQALLAAFERVVTNGRPELVLVTGYAGIGKSSVVQELHKALVPPRGLFASGKFDQYKRDIPYATLAQAFQGLIRPLLGQSEAELAGWRDALATALGPNGRLMVDLVPDLKLLMGEPPPVPELAPQDAQRRFQQVFRRFLAVFTRPEHPLVLFLDDLQWLDAATRELLEDLLSRPEEVLQHLLLIGAYRDNEVDATHPLRRTLEAIQQSGAPVQELRLGPLTREDLGRLLAEALRCEPERAAPLAKLVHQKTAGNPFFALQFVSALAEEGLLGFEYGAGRWAWDLERIDAKGYTENVMELMAGKLSRLPGETRQALQQLACLGNRAGLATLSGVLGVAEARVQAALWEAVRQELIARGDGAYHFVHDRVQEAAYSLIPATLRAEAHLRIGRRLAAHTPPEQREELIFEIVNQLNRGAALIRSPAEREQLAELNLLAGKRAKASTAYASALNHLIAGAALLADDGWERRYELAFALECNRAECEFLTGDLAAAEQRLAQLSHRAVNLADRATVTCLRINLFMTLDWCDRSIQVGLEYLRSAGLGWSPHPTKAEVRQEFQRIWQRLGGRSIQELIDLPLMKDAGLHATMDVLTTLLPPALFTNENLFCLIVAHMANVSLEHGNSDGSCLAYVWLGLLLGPHFNNYQAAFEFGQLGFDVVEKRGLNRFRARVYLDYSHVVNPWVRHARCGPALARRAWEAANETGDLTFAAYSSCNLVSTLLAAGEPLAIVQQEAERQLQFAFKARFGLIVDIITGQLRLILALRGLTPSLASFNGRDFDEGRFERHLDEDPGMAVAMGWYWVRKLQGRFLADDRPGALEAATKAAAYLWTIPSHLEVAEYHFYGALARAAYYGVAPAHRRPPLLKQLRTHHKQLKVWAQHCPENFADRVALIAAELARLEGREFEAARLYEEATRSARANGFVHQEALAHELAARFYAAHGFEQVAQLYLRNARAAYLRWGATGKVRQLEALHPHLRETEPEPVPGPTRTIEAPLAQLDLAVAMEAAQAVAGQLELDKLTETLLRLALEHAGADRGLLLLPQGPGLQIAAEARSGPEGLEVRLGPRPATGSELPEPLVRYVQRSQERLILADAAVGEPPWGADEYLQRQRPRSVLALPLVEQGRLRGLLYLENRLAPGVFTPERLALLELVAAQAAIALEHARLYADLAQENRERQEAEVRLRDSEERFRLLSESALTGVYLIQQGHFRYINPALARMFGYTVEEVVDRLSPLELVDPKERPRVAENLRCCLDGELEEIRYEFRGLRKEGSVLFVEVHGRRIEHGSQTGVIGTLVDVTERKRAEDERQAHVRFLESLDRVNQAMQGTNDLEQMMRAVLEVVRSIFGCDRAWLVYPCEPEAPAWRAVMEQTGPGYPGAFALGRELPIDPEVAEVFRTARVNPGAVRFGPGSDRPLPPKVAEQFSIQSILAMALYPKLEQPYLFGLHQCSYPRSWTAEEGRLFEEIGRRLPDAVTSLLMFRSLRDSEAKLEEAQCLAHVGYWDHNLETNRLTWSEETYRIMGLRPEEPLHSFDQILERVHPEDRPKLLEARAKAFEGGAPYDVEYRVIRPSGEVRFVHRRAEVTRDPSGRPYRLFGTLQDITERKRAEQRLLAQHRVTQLLAQAATLEEAKPQFLQALCESLAWDLGALWRTDRQAGLLRCAAFWRGAGVEAPQFEAVSRTLTFRPRVGLPGRVWLSREPTYLTDLAGEANFPRLSLAVAEGLQAACAFPVLLGGEVLGVVELFSREPRPPEPDLLELMAALGSQLGQFIERKRAEKALQQAQAELAHVMRLTTVSELATSIAHEINQPLGAIVNNAHACLHLAGAVPSPSHQLKEALSDIIDDAHRASAIIARIRALIKKTPFERAPLDLGELLAEVLGLAQRELTERRIRVVANVAPGLPRVWGDRVQLQQVFLNLVINALEAMSAVAEARRVLTLEVQRDQLGGEPAALVRVQDLGTGFGPGQAERLFEAFYTTKAQGLGMGLRISRSIVEAHGGRLWARANAPWGATFLCALPAGGHGGP